MSEKGNIDYEETLANVYMDMFKTILQFCGAWVLIWAGTLLATFGGIFLNIIGGLFWIIAPFLAGGPIALKFFMTRSFAKMFVADYEVVTTTTYSDGTTRKSSDGGMQSMMTNTFIAVIVAVILFIIGFAIQLIRFVIQIIKYIYYFIRVKQKPAFLKSGFFLMVICVAVFIGTPILAYIPINIQNARIDRAFAVVANVEESLYVKGGTVITRFDETYSEIRENADQTSTVLTKVPLGVKLTIIDDPVKHSRWYYFPVEYQGHKGWIADSFVSVVLGTATVTGNINNIPVGSTVNITDYTPPNPKVQNPNYHAYTIEYNGRFSDVDADANLIEVSPELKALLGVPR